MNELTVRNLSKSFKDNRVLNNIDFTISENEIVCLMGPSGIGKSTFLNCITNLIKPDNGSITINNIPNTAKEYQKQIGLVFQNYNLFANKTVLQNCTLALKYDKIADPEAKAMEALEKLKIADKKDEYPSHLSGGQRQRAAIARAIVLKPTILCFDEPTSALDKNSIADVTNIIKELSKEKMGILIVTHDEGFARDVATRIVEFSDINKS
ncbi:MAG: amino acid ABC transporter ATP-binding protein [Erysipelotrichaceae bacterium]